jgi:hypothetical protein
MSNAQITVKDLIEACGLASRIGFTKWEKLAEAAQAIADTISNPAAKVRFTGEAVMDLRKITPYMAEEIKSKNLDWTLNHARAQRVTPCGSVELWGSLIFQAGL